MRIRQGNDFIFLWAIERNGLPEDLSNAVNIRLHFKNFDCVGNVQSFQIVDGNIVRVEVAPKWASRLGAYRLILSYEFEDPSYSDGDRKCVVDVLAFNIVPKTSEADDLTEMAKTTDIMIGLQGLSAYEVWLKDNPDKTKEDYYNWLQEPATDIAETVNLQEQARVEAEELRVLAEQDRQSNTQEAISDAENATENANTAAQNANDARLAIQDDLALKANHGYSEEEEPKTLKEVDDDLAQLAGNLSVETETLKYELDELEKDFNGTLNIDVTTIDSSSMEQGSIAGKDGSETVSDNRIRTKDFIEVDGYFTVSVAFNFKYNVYLYGSDKEYIGKYVSGWISSKTTVHHDGFIKVVVVNNIDTLPISINDYFNLKIYTEIFKPLIAFKQGTINSADGTNDDSTLTTRIRSEFIKVNGYSLEIGDGFGYKIFHYDIDRNYIEAIPSTAFANMAVDSDFKGYIRVVLVRYPDFTEEISIDTDTGISIKSKKYTSDEYMDLDDRVSDIEGAIENSPSFPIKIKKDLMEQGSIAGKDGSETVSNDRIKTKDFIEVDGYSLEVNDLFGYMVFYYDENKEYIGRENNSFTSEKITSTYKGYIKLVIVNMPIFNTPITVDSDFTVTIIRKLNNNNNVSYKNNRRDCHFLRGGFDVVAHRGFFQDGTPENSTHSIAMARLAGFKMIEFDIRITSDGYPMIMHDTSIRRTCRNASDYSIITADVSIENSTFEDLRSNYVLASQIESYRTQIPTLREVLLECRDNDIMPLLNIFSLQGLEEAQEILGDNWACFAYDREISIKARSISNCLILHAQNSTTGVLDFLKSLGGWCGLSTTSSTILTDEFIKEMRDNNFEIQQSLPNLQLGVDMTSKGVTLLLSDYHINLRDNEKAVEYIGARSFNDFNTTGVISQGVIALSNGQSLSKNIDGILDVFGVEVEIRFKGKISLGMANTGTVVMDREDIGWGRASVRGLNNEPSFTVTSDGDSTIYEIIFRYLKIV